MAESTPRTWTLSRRPHPDHFQTLAEGERVEVIENGVSTLMARRER